MPKKIKVPVEVETKKAQKDVDKLNKSTSELSGNLRDSNSEAQNLSGGLNSLGGGFAGVVAGAKKAGAAFKALALNPIGLVITGIAAALLAVKAAFESSEAGQNKYNKLMTVMGAILGNLVDLLADVGEAIIDAFSDPDGTVESLGNSIEENLTNRFDGLMELLPQLGEAMEKLFAGDIVGASKQASDAFFKVSTGVENYSDKILDAGKRTAEFIKEQEREAALAASVADMRAKADKIERKLIVDRSILQSKIAELRLKARQEDEVSAEERKAALIEAQGLEDTLLDKETKFLELRRDAQVLENTFSRSNKENLDKEARAIAAVNNQVAARANTARQLQRELNTVNAQIEAENKRLQGEKDKAIEAEKKRLQAIDDIRKSFEDKNNLDFAANEQAKIEAQRELDLQKLENLKGTLEEKRQAELEINEFYDNKLAENEQKVNEKRLAAEKTVADTKEKIQAKTIDNVAKGVNVLASLDEDNKALQAAALIGTNAANIASTIITTLASNAKIVAEGAALAIPTAGASVAAAASLVAANNVSAGISVAGSVAATAKGLAELGEGGGGGGGGITAPAGGGNASASANPISQESLFSTQNLEGAESEVVGGEAGINQQPIKAVVVESDITEAQNNLSNLKQRSEIG